MIGIKELVTPDLIGISIDAASLVVVVAMALYGMKLIFIMRRGSLERSWRFAALGSIFFTIGILLFALDAAFPYAGQVILPFLDIGGAIMLIGGLMLLQSFRIQYKIFQVKFSFEKQNEKIKDLA